MSRKPSPSARTTVYRLRRLPTLKDAVIPKYLSEGGFLSHPARVGGRDALLVTGTIRAERVRWASRLSTLAGTEVHLGSAYAAALLLIEDGADQAWAITYGLGFHLFDRAFLDPGFGMRFAIRTATPEAIQSLTRSELDHRARTDRSSIPAGATLPGFGMGGFGEVVTRISGAAEVDGLTIGEGRFRVHAADALSLPLAKAPEALIRDLDAISTTLALDAKPELKALEQFVRVKHKETIQRLEAELRSELLNEGKGRLSIGWPHERVHESGTPSSYRLVGTGRRDIGIGDGLPTLDEIVERVIGKNPDDPLSATKTIKVQLFRDGDGEEPMSGEIPVINWLFYEIELGSIRYCLFDSFWYAMDTDYAVQLDSRISQIFAREPRVDLPTWHIADCGDEATYNRMAASFLGGIVLDRRFVRTTQNPRGFEACDIITPKGDLVHIKNVYRSSEASHLIAQAVVSTSALRYDNEARQKLREIVVESGGDTEWVQRRPDSVVLGMARSCPVTASDLFSFTQVTLSRLDISLAMSGVQLTVAPIHRV